MASAAAEEGPERRRSQEHGEQERAQLEAAELKEEHAPGARSASAPGRSAARWRICTHVFRHSAPTAPAGHPPIGVKWPAPLALGHRVRAAPRGPVAAEALRSRAVLDQRV